MLVGFVNHPEILIENGYFWFDLNQYSKSELFMTDNYHISFGDELLPIDEKSESFLNLWQTQIYFSTDSRSSKKTSVLAIRLYTTLPYWLEPEQDLITTCKIKTHGVGTP